MNSRDYPASAPSNDEHPKENIARTIFIVLLVVAVFALIIFVLWWCLYYGGYVGTRDISACTLAANHIMSDCGNIKNMKTCLLSAQAFSTPPLILAQTEIELTGKHSFIVLSNTTATDAAVILPQSSCFAGLQLLIVSQQTTASNFTVEPASGDTIEDSSSPVSSVALIQLISTGSTWIIVQNIDTL